MHFIVRDASVTDFVTENKRHSFTSKPYSSSSLRLHLTCDVNVPYIFSCLSQMKNNLRMQQNQICISGITIAFVILSSIMEQKLKWNSPVITTYNTKNDTSAERSLLSQHRIRIVLMESIGFLKQDFYKSVLHVWCF